MIKIRTARPVETAVNITPLVDIVFLLLIFFLLSAFFIQPEGMGVKLPQADGDPAGGSEEIVVVVETGGGVVFREQAVSLDRLEDLVRPLLEADSNATVVVKADKKVALQAVVSVMERLKNAGAGKMVIATETPSSRPGL